MEWWGWNGDDLGNEGLVVGGGGQGLNQLIPEECNVG